MKLPALLCLVAIAAAADAVPTLDSVRPSLEREIPRLIGLSRITHLPHVPGLSIAVVDRGEVTWAAGFGVTREGGPAVTADTPFEAASLGKPVTAYLALQLADAKTLDLDTPLAKYVTYADLPADPRAASITARHVLSHTTGFPNWRRNDPLKLYFTPGARFSYSGEGYVYLQHAIEAVTKTSFEQAVERYVFEPLHMTRSSFVAAASDTRAMGHSDIGTPLPPRPPAGLPTANAAASLVTTASDYGHFLAAVLKGTRLSPATARAMFTPQVQLDPSCTNCIDHEPAARSQNLAWGLGWGLEESSAGRTIWHWGDNPGFKNYVAAALPSQRGFVFFTNSDDGLSLRDSIVDIVIGGSHPAAKLLSYRQIGPNGLPPR